MFILNIILILLVGLIIGSFVTAVALRISNEEKVFVRRSKCDSCANNIPYKYLLPIIGYILCRGKCTICKRKVSMEYTMWEVLHALLYIVAYLLCNNISLFFTFGLFTSILLLITIIDIKTQYVYDVHTIFLSIVMALILYEVGALKFSIISCFIAVIPLFFKYLYEGIRAKITGVKMEIIGMGDIKLFIILFFLLDFYIILEIMVLSGFIGAVYGLVLRKKNAHYAFLPSVSLALYIVFIYNFI